MGKTSTVLANGVQQGRSFLEAAKQPVGGEISATPPLQLRRPELIEGELGFIFTDVEVKRLAEDFKFALILKFLSFRPNFDLVREAIARTWGLREVPVVSHMDASHVLVKMKNEGDFLVAWAREVGSTTLWQRVKYEKLGFYCKKCRRQGHTEAVCRVGQQFHEKQKMKKVVNIGPEKQEWRKKKWRSSGVGLEKRYVQEAGDMAKLGASVSSGIIHEQGRDDIGKVGESSRGITPFVDNDKEKMDVTETELGRENNMVEISTVVSKTSGIEVAKIGGDTHVKSLDRAYLVDGKQDREEGEIEDRDILLNEDMVVTIEGNEKINIMATHITVRADEDQGVQDIVEELQEDSRDHGGADEAMTMSDKEVEGMVEELGNICDCISDFEQRAKGHPGKTVHKTNMVRYGPTPFKFQQMWTTHESFKNYVLTIWEGNSEHIQRLEKELEKLDASLQVSHSEEIKYTYLATKVELDTWEKREGMRLAQIAKQRWIEKAPASILKLINRIFSDFFWGYADGKPKRKWIAWDKVCMPVKEGRAGLRSLQEVRLSLHMKFAWKILTETSLWSTFFRVKYIKDKHVSQVDATKGSRFWKMVMSCMPDVLNRSRWRVKEGGVSFW
ncbi:unnamed protein product [Fraxinus pennsylvanica]|uniref:DUF4283 domain-containing protein n=1 Tax=Fraxinus pennsylvanica TaxID=56036 RepID=A0AAD2EG08_9LAMI|nr:unnamed protein product [Fraxinus pennsylvanica]